MALWTDIIDPATLTGYARASLADYEARRGSLNVFLPNRFVPDIVARFVQGSTGLVDIASFRAYDAEPEIGKAPSGKRVTIELPALGQNIPVSEYNQLRARNGNLGDATVLAGIQQTTDIVVRAVSDSMERLRGTVIETGVATVSGFMADSFGRSGTHTVTAGTLWSTTTADALGDLQAWTDTYRTDTGVDAGALLMSTRVLRAMAKLTQMASQLGNGGTRPATQQNVRDTVESATLPPIYVYDRNVSIAGVKTKVLSDNKIYILPTPVDPNDEAGTELGGTFWGQTLTSTDPDYGLEDVDMPGLVAGVYRGEKPPMIAEVISDAIGMPVLANADLSMVATVL